MVNYSSASVPLPFAVDPKLGKTSLSEPDDVVPNAGPLKGTRLRFVTSTTETTFLTTSGIPAEQHNNQRLTINLDKPNEPPEITSRSIATEIGSTVVHWSRDSREETLSISEKVGRGGSFLKSEIDPDETSMNAFIMRRTKDGVSYLYEDGNTGAQRPVSRKEFITAASTYVGAHDQEWVLKLSKSLPEATAGLDSKAPPSVETMLHASPTIAIQTNGTCSIVAPVGPNAKGALYQKDAPTKPAVMPRSFEADTFIGTTTPDKTILGAFKEDKAITNSIPAHVRDQLAKAIETGLVIRIDHVDTVAGCPTTGNKAPSADSSRKR